MEIEIAEPRYKPSPESLRWKPLTGCFGKSEVETTAERLIEFLAVQGIGWSSFSLAKLWNFYLVRQQALDGKNWKPEECLDGLMPWADYGDMIGQIFEPPVWIVSLLSGRLAVTRSFVDRCAGKKNEKKRIATTEPLPTHEDWCLINHPETGPLHCTCKTSSSISKWDKRFLDVASHIASWSKDPNDKVGCVIIDDDHNQLSGGYNGFPRRVQDTEERLNNRDLKRSIVVHAEANAIAGAARNGHSVKDATAYITRPPCSQCASGLIQAGIKRVVFYTAPESKHWAASAQLAEVIMQEAGLEVVPISKSEEPLREIE